jgi:hypothetical protein
MVGKCFRERVAIAEQGRKMETVFFDGRIPENIVQRNTLSEDKGRMWRYIYQLRS